MLRGWQKLNEEWSALNNKQFIFMAPIGNENKNQRCSISCIYEVHTKSQKLMSWGTKMEVVNHISELIKMQKSWRM